MLYINRVLFTRWSNLRRGLSTSLVPGGTNVENTIALSEHNPDLQPLSEDELALLGPDQRNYLSTTDHCTQLTLLSPHYVEAPPKTNL